MRAGVALVNTMSTEPDFAAANTSALFVNTTGSNGTPARCANSRPSSNPTPFALPEAGSPMIDVGVPGYRPTRSFPVGASACTAAGFRAVERPAQPASNATDSTTTCRAQRRSGLMVMLSAIVRCNQSGLIPADLTTPDQSSVCDLMKAVNRSGVPGATTTPSSPSLFAIAGFASALLVSALSCRTISGGVLAGATRPHQTDAS